MEYYIIRQYNHSNDNFRQNSKNIDMLQDAYIFIYIYILQVYIMKK